MAGIRARMNRGGIGLGGGSTGGAAERFVGMRWAETKAGFFDRIAIQKAVDRTGIKNLSKAGAFIRRTAKRLLCPAPQKTLGEMTPEERETYARRLKEWKDPKRDRRGRFAGKSAKARGVKRPRKPDRISQPGKPPYLHVRPIGENPLRSLIYFAYDMARRALFVGPVQSGDGKAPRRLEKGVDGYEARPFMAPAYDEEEERIAALWRNSIKG